MIEAYKENGVWKIWDDNTYQGVTVGEDIDFKALIETFERQLDEQGDL